MLILFDVDATLITTSRAGIRALELAGRELLGEGFTIEGTDFAGRLDPLIIADLLAANAHLSPPLRAGAPGPRPGDADLRAGYARHLHGVLAAPGTRCLTLPGVVELLAALRDRAPAVTSGLLTGNYPETGRTKLTACGLNADDFHLAVWADDATGTPPSRNELPGVAIARWRAIRPRADVHPRSVVVIGDTPHDVACARAHGCRCLAVATGVYSVEQLRAAGADHAVPTLADTPAVLDWLLTAPAA